jgi:caffeoyl-CoA O-methyltransferase
MADNISYQQVQAYLNELVPERPKILQSMENYAREKSFPIIGPAAGELCYQIARMMNAHQIFELGSGFGYSTAWFARAVKENSIHSKDGSGAVHHVVWDEKLSRQAQQYLGQLGYEGIVEFHVGEAVKTLANTPGTFDLIFNDIDKEGYPASLPVIREKLRPGGVLIVDNMLWHGRIFDASDQDESTKGVRDITQLLFESPEWIATLLPIRDGLIVAYKQ